MPKQLWALCFFPIFLSSQPGPLPAVKHVGGADWTWRDANNQVRTRQELDVILKEHESWISTNHERGRQARLVHADLSRALLNGTNLSYTYLSGSDLSGASLWMANLRGANLRAANLSGADFRYADLAGTNYEPKVNPEIASIAYAKGLGYLTWDVNSGPVFALRKSFLEAGFRDASRQVTAAIHRHGQNILERLLFDQTCEWGANWLLPLELVGVLCLMCTIVYWVGLHFGRRSGLYLIATGQRITTSKGKVHVFRIRVRPPKPVAPKDQLELEFAPSLPQKSPSLSLWRTVRLETRALGTAFFFSVVSAFNIGFREFNLGRWIRIIQPREFDIQASGWMRVVSGIQSLLGAGLVALSVLSYFGQPFD